MRVDRALRRDLLLRDVVEALAAEFLPPPIQGPILHRWFQTLGGYCCAGCRVSVFAFRRPNAAPCPGRRP